jgi:hypothetical protein
MALRLAIALVVTCSITAPAAAQEADEWQIIPVVARTAGVGGTQWVSDLTVYNTTSSTLDVGTQYFPADRDNAFNPDLPDRFVLAPGETRFFPDVLSTVFGIETDSKGVLIVTTDENLIPTNPEDAQILAVSRTYNTGGGDGTYGQTVNSLLIAMSGSAQLPLFATGVRNDDAFRSNLGVVNVSFLEAVTIHYRIVDADGEIIATGTRNLPRTSLKQWSLAQLGVGTIDGPMTVQVWIDPSDGAPDPCAVDDPNIIMAYVSKVDNATGDGEFLLASPLEEWDCPDD